MSKQASDKIIVTVEQNPLLLELDLPELLKEYKKFADQMGFHKTKMDFYDVKRTAVKASIGVIIDTVHADSVVYVDPEGVNWKSTMVRPEAAPVLDEDKLRVNMMKIGKLPAPVVQEIFKLSTVPGKPKASYVKVTGSNPEKG